MRSRRVRKLRTHTRARKRPPASHPVGQNPSEVGIADLDGDGILDLAVANTYSSTVSILLGNGTGGFGPATHFPAGYAPWRMAIGDIDGDNVPDIAAVNDFQGVAVLRGTGAGAFAPPILYTPGSRAWAVALGDFNGDGSLDLAVPDSGSSHLSILRNSGTGNFGLPVDFPVGTSPSALAVADLNGDGALDVATVNGGYGGRDVLLQLPCLVAGHWADSNVRGAERRGRGKLAGLNGAAGMKLPFEFDREIFKRAGGHLFPALARMAWPFGHMQ